MGDGREQAAPTLPARVASDLAARSDAVAAKLDAGDPCGALADAESLRREAQAAVTAGRVPPRYRRELTAAVGALAASISCTPPPPDDDEAEGEDDDEDKEEDDDKHDDDDKGKKKGKDNGKGKGKKGGRG